MSKCIENTVDERTIRTEPKTDQLYARHRVQSEIIQRCQGSNSERQNQFIENR